MEWQVILALIVCVGLCFLPVIMAWHHYFGRLAHAAHKKTSGMKKMKMTVKTAGAGV